MWTSFRCRCPTLPSIACCSCMRWRWRMIPLHCCVRSGACWQGQEESLPRVPNWRGVWARTDTTPFGHGRPYSRSQITQLLREAWFTPTGWGEALHVPPVARGWSALRHGMGTGGLSYRCTVCRRAHRGGNEAGLSRRARKANTIGAGPGARARALAARRVGRCSVVLVWRFVHAWTAASALQIRAGPAVTPAAAMQWETVAMAVMPILRLAGAWRGLMHGRAECR